MYVALSQSSLDISCSLYTIQLLLWALYCISIGLQLGYFFQQAGSDYVIFEKNDTAGNVHECCVCVCVCVCAGV